MLSPHFPQPPPCFKLWPSQPLNLSEVRSQSGQGAFIRFLKVKRKRGGWGKKQRVPVHDRGYLAKMATILEGDMVKTGEREEMM